MSSPLALITGAASGIGLAAARRMAEQGWRLLLCDRDAEGLALAAAELGAEAVLLDISDVPAVRETAARLLAAHGHVDAVVVCAGISGHGLPFEKVDEAAFDAMLGTHLKGHFFLLQALAPAMAEAGGGAMVLVSSLFALRGSPNMPHYTAAKGALLGLGRALAVELGPKNIRVNVVAPGLIRTPMTEKSAGYDKDFFTRRETVIPLRRLATPEDVAASIAFLASPAAASLTGQCISPSGGEAFT